MDDCPNCLILEKRLREMGEFALTSADYIAALKTEVATLEAERDAAQREIERLKEDVACGLNLTASFFEALKPLKLSMINVADPGSHVTALIAERDAAYLEIQRLKLDDILHAPFRCKDCDYKTNIEVNLEAHCNLHASLGLAIAYLKGLEEGKQIADTMYFQIGVLKYPCTEVADAIQRKIDEAKGK